MGGIAIDHLSGDDDSVPPSGDTELPDDYPDPFVEADFDDPSDDLAALFPVRHQLERSRERFD